MLLLYVPDKRKQSFSFAYGDGMKPDNILGEWFIVKCETFAPSVSVVGRFYTTPEQAQEYEGY